MKQEPSDVLCFECDHGFFMHGKYIYCLKKHGVLHFTKKKLKVFVSFSSRAMILMENVFALQSSIDKFSYKC